MATKMHPDELEIDGTLVRRLIASQFPHWGSLAIVPVSSGGTDNALFRLGDELVIRLPKVSWAAPQVEKEVQWLPMLAPHLPLATPEPLALGKPAERYPYFWSVCRWLNGETALPERLADPIDSAKTLGRFVRTLRAIDASDGPAAGEHNFGRGAPLATRDERFRASLPQIADEFDVSLAERVWNVALTAPIWSASGLWVHGDLQPGNLLCRSGHLTAVIDFGGLGVGDPAVDLLPAWNLFDGESRAVYRDEIHLDNAAWERGKGWALSVGVIALPYYRESNPTIANLARTMIREVLADAVAVQ